MIKTLPTLLGVEQRLAIVTDQRTSYDVASGRPFSGPLGDAMMNEFRKNGINVAASYIACCNDSEFGHVSTESPCVVQNLLELTADLKRIKPNLVLLVGRTCLALAGIDKKLDNFRGSLFICEEQSSPFYGFKCLATYGTREAVKDDNKAVMMQFDVKRAKTESLKEGLILPKLLLYPDPSYDELIGYLRAIKSGDTISIDIEGGIPNPTNKKYPNTKGITCVGVATSPTRAFIVNPWDFSEDKAMCILREFGRVMADGTISKILQNSLYDNFVISWLWKVLVRGVTWDTMLSGWEIYPEMQKSLEVQVSVYTRWPYYKDEKAIPDRITHYLYCLKDAAYTYEIAEVHKRVLKGPSLEHFKLNVQLLPALLYSELRGLNYRIADAAQALADINSKLEVVQARIDTIAGRPLNPNSPKQCCDHLYTICGYEKMYKKKPDGTESLTTDVNALLILLKKYGQPPIILQLLLHRTLSSLKETLEITTDEDGRVRCSYNAVGTDTGRLSCQTSPTRSGANLQTITKKLRHLYRADEGFDFFEADLSGADGWTVAVKCMQAGDSTMLDDYLFGLKPAKIIALMYQEWVDASKRFSKTAMASFRSDINRLNRPALLKMTDLVETKTGWLYHACKVIQHGTNYDMKPPTMSMGILRDSHKKNGQPIYVAVSDCDILQKLYKARYPGVNAFHSDINGILAATRRLTSASGNTRRFFGRPYEASVQRSGYSHIPQNNTTYATKLALLRLWTDPDNRLDDLPIIEPLHQIHDAIAGQWPSERREWACAKMHDYFKNPINIDGYTLTIPFEGHWGTDWGTLPNDI